MTQCDMGYMNFNGPSNSMCYCKKKEEKRKVSYVMYVDCRSLMRLLTETAVWPIFIITVITAVTELKVSFACKSCHKLLSGIFFQLKTIFFMQKYTLLCKSNDQTQVCFYMTVC